MICMNNLVLIITSLRIDQKTSNWSRLEDISKKIMRYRKKKEGGGFLGALQNLSSGPQIAKKPSNHNGMNTLVFLTFFKRINENSCVWSHLIENETRPDTRLPKSRECGQGPYLRSPDHLGRSSGVKKIKS